MEINLFLWWLTVDNELMDHNHQFHHPPLKMQCDREHCSYLLGQGRSTLATSKICGLQLSEFLSQPRLDTPVLESFAYTRIPGVIFEMILYFRMGLHISSVKWVMNILQYEWSQWAFIVNLVNSTETKSRQFLPSPYN